MKYRIESLPDVDSPREGVQVITVWVEGGRGSMGPMHVIGLSNLAKVLAAWPSFRKALAEARLRLLALRATWHS